MPKDIDEDLIEATIRRVQAQSSPPEDGETDEEAAASHAQDVEATIRRVQASARASLDAGERFAASDEGPPDDEDPIEATIRRVQEQAAAAHLDHPSPANEGESAPPGDSEDDDDPIAATIRRVQSQAAVRTHEESSDFAPAPIPSFDQDDPEPDSSAQFTEPPPAEEERLVIEPTEWPGRDDRLLGEPESWEIAAARLEQGLQDNSRQIRELAARLDTLMATIERLVHGVQGSPALTVVSPPGSAGDDWDAPPRPSAMQFGTPPRPPVLRDPSPNTATARELEEVQAPAAHLRPVEAGSLDDRLPRQYRITVEDKRRGVDLVPLHRAMQGLANVRDMSLLSYNNGVAIVLIETVGPLDPEVLREAVGRSMARETKIEVHNESTMVVKVQED